MSGRSRLFSLADADVKRTNHLLRTVSWLVTNCSAAHYAKYNSRHIIITDVRT